MRHIGSVHAWEPRFRLTCGIEGCMRKYKSYRCYRDHTFSKHSELLPAADDSTSTDEPLLQDSEHVYSIEGSPNPSESTDVLTNRPKTYNKALFLLKLKEERRLPQVAVDGLIGDISILLDEEILSLKQNVIQYMQEGHVSAELISKVNEEFTERVYSPFEGLQTAFFQKKYFINHFNLVVCTMYMLLFPYCICDIIGTSRT